MKYIFLIVVLLGGAVLLNKTQTLREVLPASAFYAREVCLQSLTDIDDKVSAVACYDWIKFDNTGEACAFFKEYFNYDCNIGRILYAR